MREYIKEKHIPLLVLTLILLSLTTYENHRLQDVINELTQANSTVTHEFNTCKRLYKLGCK